jgi:ribosomal protein L37AE/L43A
MKQNAAMERLQDGDTVQSSVCPLCDTLRHAIMSETLATGAVWKCTRCGQAWSAERIAKAAAHAR